MTPHEGEIIFHCGHPENGPAPWRWFYFDQPLACHLPDGVVASHWIAACADCHGGDDKDCHLTIGGYFHWHGAVSIGARGLNTAPPTQCAVDRCRHHVAHVLRCAHCRHTLPTCEEHHEQHRTMMQGHLLRLHPDRLGDEAMQRLAGDPAAVAAIEGAWRQDPEGFNVLMERLRRFRAPSTLN